MLESRFLLLYEYVCFSKKKNKNNNNNNNNNGGPYYSGVRFVHMFVKIPLILQPNGV